MVQQEKELREKFEAGERKLRKLRESGILAVPSPTQPGQPVPSRFDLLPAQEAEPIPERPPLARPQPSLAIPPIQGETDRQRAERGQRISLQRELAQPDILTEIIQSFTEPVELAVKQNLPFLSEEQRREANLELTRRGQALASDPFFAAGVAAPLAAGVFPSLGQLRAGGREVIREIPEIIAGEGGAVRFPVPGGRPPGVPRTVPPPEAGKAAPAFRVSVGDRVLEVAGSNELQVKRAVRQMGLTGPVKILGRLSTTRDPRLTGPVSMQAPRVAEPVVAPIQPSGRLGRVGEFDVRVEINQGRNQPKLERIISIEARSEKDALQKVSDIGIPNAKAVQATRKPVTPAARPPVPPAVAVEPPLPPSRPPIAAAAQPTGPAPRRGPLLQAPPASELGANYGVKDVLRVARSLDDKRTAVANVVLSRTKTALRDVGKLDKNGHMLDVPGRPSIYDVAENPTAYQLTPQQRTGLTKLNDVIESIRAERQAFGVAPNEIAVFDEGHFLPRTVKKVGGEEVTPRGAGGGLRGGGAERGRRVGVGEVAAAEARGTVYAHPLESVTNYTNRWLKASGDTHVRDLLVPFSETSSTRVSPALRERVVGLRQQVQSLRQSGITLAEKEDAALRAFLSADDPSIDALRDVVDKIRIVRGQFSGQDFAQAQATLRDIKVAMRDVAPEWRSALEAAKTPRPGRQTVPSDVAPLLAGRDFEPGVAKSLLKHYGASGPARTQTQRAVNVTQKIVNAPVRFFNATMDLSALLRQQASAAATHPVAWFRNAVKSFRDVVTSKEYDLMVGSPKGQQAASRGIAVFGNAGEIAEFQAASWMDQIPLVRQANNHFIRYNTRQRIELFHLEVDRLAKKFKKALTIPEEEAVARAINRATGVSTTKGGDLEANVLFASRYTRSSIEEVIKAASSGQIEGQIARRYIGHLVAVATMASTALAIKQKRPLDEILNPLDSDALRRGSIALNPNFLSMRIFGHDVKPLGVYDSLARLMFVAGDSINQAVSQRDAVKLFDFFSYAASTKGSPLVSFGADLMKQTTFNDEDPLSPGALGKRVLPFTAQNVIQDLQSGAPVGEAIAGGIVEGVGLKTSPMSFSDFTSEVARERYGVKYQTLEPYQRDVVREDIEAGMEEGRIPRRQPRDGYWKALDDINQRFDEQLEGIINLLESRTIKRSQVAGLYYSATDESRNSKDQAARDFNVTFDEPDPNEKDVNKRSLNGYFALFDEAVVEGNFLFEKFDSLRAAYERGLEPEQLQYVYRNTNRRDIPRGILNNLSRGTRSRLAASQQARARHDPTATPAQVPTQAPTQVPAQAPVATPTAGFDWEAAERKLRERQAAGVP